MDRVILEPPLAKRCMRHINISLVGALMTAPAALNAQTLAVGDFAKPVMVHRRIFVCGRGHRSGERHGPQITASDQL